MRKTANNDAAQDKREPSGRLRILVIHFALYFVGMILVVPARYRNPTSPGEYTVNGPGWWWPKEVVPHLVADRLEIAPGCWLMGDMRVGATAVNPLTGLHGLTRGASGISYWNSVGR